MGLGRAVHGMFIPELPVGLLRQNLLYTVYPQNSRYFDEKAIFTHFERDFFISKSPLLTRKNHTFNINTLPTSKQDF